MCVCVFVRLQVVVGMYNDYGKLNSLFKGPDFTRHSKVLRDRHWIVNLAPEPEDIVWSVSCLVFST